MRIGGFGGVMAARGLFASKAAALAMLSTVAAVGAAQASQSRVETALTNIVTLHRPGRRLRPYGMVTNTFNAACSLIERSVARRRDADAAVACPCAVARTHRQATHARLDAQLKLRQLCADLSLGCRSRKLPSACCRPSGRATTQTSMTWKWERLDQDRAVPAAQWTGPEPRRHDQRCAIDDRL